MHFIPQKLTIPAGLPHVTRERLLGSLQESLDCCSSTIVSGRAGAGKTMLAAEFARLCGRRVAWYKVDAYDGELRTFFQYLCASVNGQRPGFGDKTIARLGEPIRPEDVPLLVEYFIYELLEETEPLLIVIDDLHLVYDAEWIVPFFRRLLPLLPPEVHIMLVGRSLPPAPLWRLRSKQTLSVIDEPSLAFTREEARKLFALYGLEHAQAEDAWRRTRGRAANLHEMACAIGADPAPAETDGGDVEQRHGYRLRLVNGFSPKTSMGTA